MFHCVYNKLQLHTHVVGLTSFIRHNCQIYQEYLGFEL